MPYNKMQKIYDKRPLQNSDIFRIEIDFAKVSTNYNELAIYH